VHPQRHSLHYGPCQASGIAHNALEKFPSGGLQTPNVRSYCMVAVNTSSIFRLVAQPVADCWLSRLSVQIGCETPP